MHPYETGSPADCRKTTFEAIEGDRKATQVRPNWPYRWASRALRKASGRQFDTEFEGALIKAVTLGPWENSVNISVAEAGLLGWTSLAPSTQNAVIENIERGLKRNAPALKKSLKAINKLGMVCIYLKASNERTRLCGL